MKAFISDIHANSEALCAVIEDISLHRVDQIVCLGDIVGYGADFELCVDMVMSKANPTILGNHDWALLYAPLGFNPIATEVINLTKKIMRPPVTPDTTPDADDEYYLCPSAEECPRCLIQGHSKNARWEYIQSLPSHIEQDDLLFVHGSPLDPTFEYVVPDTYVNLWKPVRIQDMFTRIKRVCFCGHTHHPCIITSDLTCVNPKDCNYEYQLDPAKKYIVNTGSVGQPRDLDPRSGYVLYDETENKIYWRRIPYDIDATAAKIKRMCGEKTWCASRLYQGQ
jgi:diadenosine tetraphosphatase ApaH/serine/threonine PP2A family protein phosphatase